MTSDLRSTVMRGFGTLALLAVLLTLSTSLSAQNVASLTGLVTDISGAALPAVDVKLVDTKTNISHETASNAVGAYRFDDLPPGPGYKVTFSKEGFTTVTVTGLYLATQTIHTQNASMQVGQVAVIVEVKGAGSSVSLDTTDTAVSTDFDMNKVHELPIQIRDNPAALIVYSPGVVDVGAGSSSDSNGSRGGAVAGARIDQNNVTLDGLDVNDFGTGQAFLVNGNAPVDSVQEFRGETANQLSAEGRGSGAQIQLTTKSGTNAFHGGANDFNRVTATEANNFFNNLSGLPRPPLIRNQFGVNIGGPVIKDKLFFFFDYNGRRDDIGITTENIVPLDTWRGDGISSTGIPAIGYISGTANGGTCTSLARSNTDPSCISYVSASANANGQTLQGIDPAGTGVNGGLLAFIKGRYPHANDFGVGDGINTGGVRFNAPAHVKENNYVTRIDSNLSGKMKLFGRFSILRSYTDDFVNFPAPIAFPGDPITHQIVDTTYSYVVGHTWTISPTKVNQFVYGETRAQLNFPTTFNPNGFVDYSVFGNVTNPYFSQSDQGRIVPIPIYKDDFTYSRGTHTIQVGGTFKPIKVNDHTLFDLDNITLGIGGNLNALPASQQPVDILEPGTNDPVGLALGQWNASFPFLLGRIANVQVIKNNNRNLQPLPSGSNFQLSSRYYETEVYLQDTWRARSDLTLNYGLRYQYYSVPYEAGGLEALANQGFNQFFVPRLQAGLQGSPGPFQPVSFGLAGKANHALGYYHPDWRDFAPRFGVAYNPSFTSDVLGKALGDRKTVIRAGAGVVFDHTVTSALAFFQQQLSGIFQDQAATPGSSLATDPRFTTFDALPANLNQPKPPTNPFTPDYIAGVPVGEALGAFTYSTDPNLKTPYSETITVGVQRELPGHFQLDVTYFGRFGRRLLAQADAGQTVDFRDASGQTLNQAFSLLEGEIRSGTNPLAVTAQPFFENQTMGGTALCQTVSATATQNFPNCTSIVAAGNQTLLATGSLGSIMFTEAALGQLQQFGLAPVPGMVAGVGLNPQYGLNVYASNKGASNYHGLLTALHRKLANGLQFDLNYTYSHSIDNTSVNANNFSGQGANFAGGLLCDANNPRLCRGNSEFDITHILSSDWIYDLPFGRGRRFGTNMSKGLDYAVGGWQLAVLNSWHTGFAFPAVANAEPISINNNVPPIFNGDRSALKVNIHKTSSGSIQLFANQTAAIGAFSPPTGLQAGSRDILRGPRYSNFNISLNKRFPVTERVALELQAQAYNVFNHTNFDLPGNPALGTEGTADFTNPGQFGLITSTADPRQMQFGLEVKF